VKIEKFLRIWSEEKICSVLGIDNTNNINNQEVLKAHIHLMEIAETNQQLLPLLYVFEHLYRNIIHSQISTIFNNANWLTDLTDTKSPLYIFFQRQMRKASGQSYKTIEKVINETKEAKRRVKRGNTKKHNPTISEGQILAEFSFGFWCYLTQDVMCKLYEAYSPKPFSPIRTIFCNYSNKKPVQKIRDNLDKIRKIRNRIAHHEKVHNPYLFKKLILLMIGSLDSEIKEYYENYFKDI